MAVRRTWRLRSRRGKYFLLHKRDLLDTDQPLPPELAWTTLSRILDAPEFAADLAVISAALSDENFRAAGKPNRGLLQRAIYSGSLLLVSDWQSAGGSNSNTQEPKEEESAAEQIKNARQVKTWVEVQLVDMAGSPVAGKRYEVMLPDGTRQTGMLDENGLIRFNNIDPGNCVLVFPELDSESWERIS